MTRKLTGKAAWRPGCVAVAGRPFLTWLRADTRPCLNTPWRKAALAEVDAGLMDEGTAPAEVRLHMIERGLHHQGDFDAARTVWRDAPLRPQRDREARDRQDERRRNRGW